MATEFESIFTTNSDVDPSLNKLFTRKIKVHKESIEEEAEETEVEAKRENNTKTLKKIKKADQESEKGA